MGASRVASPGQRTDGVAHDGVLAFFQAERLNHARHALCAVRGHRRAGALRNRGSAGLVGEGEDLLDRKEGLVLVALQYGTGQAGKNRQRWIEK